MTTPEPINLPARVERAEQAITALIAAADRLKRNGRGENISLSEEHLEAVHGAADIMGIELPSETGEPTRPPWGTLG
jgi:hypothetical protein